MTIETKYNPQDSVFRMKDNQVVQDMITEVIVRIRKYADAPPFVEETYILQIGGGGWDADKFFPSKEALLKSL